MRIALVGEYDASYPPHVATSAALNHSAQYLDVDVEYDWVSTAHITPNLIGRLHGAWVAPGSPYRNMKKTLDLIQHMRTQRVPCFGTCGGFQHMVIEFARNQLGIQDAEHAEYNPDASRLIVARLDCSLAGKEMLLRFTPESFVAKVYEATRATERYYCNFGIDPSYAKQISDQGFRIVGSDEEGTARVMVLEDHPFFVGTLFVPQMRSTSDSPHPLVTAFLRAVVSQKDRNELPAG